MRRQRDTTHTEIEVVGQMDNIELHSGTVSTYTISVYVRAHLAVLIQ